MRVPQHRSAGSSNAAPRPRAGPGAPERLVTDEQIVALVCAAARLRRRQLQRPTQAVAGAEQRRARLDWAVRAGQVALADRRRARAAGAETAEVGR